MIRRRLFFGIFIVGALAVQIAGLAVGISQAILNKPLSLPSETSVYLERGNGVLRLGYMLRGEGAVPALWHTVYAARYLGITSSLQAGEYAVRPGMTLAEFLNTVVRGDRIQRRIVIPEGVSVKQVRTILDNAFGLVGTDRADLIEGSLLPETYYYERGDTAVAVIARMQSAQAALLDGLWAARKPGLPISTVQEAITLASIVEKETAVAGERPLVAAVFVNRMHQGMKLQSDPTVIYGLTGGLPLGHGLKRSELRRDTLYNTYKIRGLPPGPIGNPGAEAIKAVLNPPDVPYLYFVADGSGGHAFATTLREHNRNVQRWRAFEKAL